MPVVIIVDGTVGASAVSVVVATVNCVCVCVCNITCVCSSLSDFLNFLWLLQKMK